MPLSSCHFERLHCLSLSPCWPELGVQFHFYLLPTRKQWKLVMNSRKKMKLLYLTFNLRKELSSLICIIFDNCVYIAMLEDYWKTQFSGRKVLSDCWMANTISEVEEQTKKKKYYNNNHFIYSCINQYAHLPCYNSPENCDKYYTPLPCLDLHLWAIGKCGTQELGMLQTTRHKKL